MMRHTDEFDVATCDEHPGRTFTNEEAAAHLRAEHPEFWSFLGRIETVPLNNRRAKRAAAREARRNVHRSG